MAKTQKEVEIDQLPSKRNTMPLRLRTKLYEFYVAPVSKYISHTVKCVNDDVESSG